MSRILVQPVGQKRLTNVAVVRMKKHGTRFEIACFKNKVLSWRSSVEKDIDEVLQSHTVYTNVSKGVVAKSKDLIAAFGTDDQTKICIEILDKGELQVAGKEREAQLSSQFRDIATIVMEKTFNPETKRPYTISMIERLMHEIHFAVDPNSNSKKQALEVIHQLEDKYPIRRSPMRLRITTPKENSPSLLEKLNEWHAINVTKEESGSQSSVICDLDPSNFKECGPFVQNLQGKFEILAVSVHAEGDGGVDNLDDFDEESFPIIPKEQSEQSDSSIIKLSEKLKKQSVATSSKDAEGEKKQSKCSTCNALVGDAKQYREHFKSEWHKHNLKRKTRNLAPLSVEECLANEQLECSKEDLKEYSF